MKMEYKIPEIENPKEIIAQIKKLSPYFKRARNRKDFNSSDGVIELGELPQDILFPYQLFLWICRTNEIIENLNLILHDLDILSKKPHHFVGSHRVRYFLLLRTFFYEFFRIKEVSNVYLKRFKKLGVIDNEDFKNIKSDTYKLFEETLKTRNALVHKETSPSGVHLEFHKRFSIYESGFKILDRKTGVESKWEDSLKKACGNSLDILFNEGKRMSEIMQEVFVFWSKTIMKASV